MPQILKKTKEKTKGKTKKKTGHDAFLSFIAQTLLCVVILYVLFAHMVGIMSMPNADMYPRIDSGDFLLYYRLDKSPKAQDIMVFEKNETTYVGRVIAVGGDTIEITKDGAVIVNGYSMSETNIFYETYPLKGFTEYPCQLAEDQCFIMMDQRQGTEDSRFFGPVSHDELKGTVISVMRRNNL